MQYVVISLWFLSNAKIQFFISSRCSPRCMLKGETLKSSLSYLKEHLKVSYLSVFDSLASFLRYFSFFDMQITYDVVYGE